MRVNYVVNPTYRCNLKCRDCYQMFDLFPCGSPNSDLTEEDVVEAGKQLLKAGVEVYGIKISGGEPMLHPGLADLCGLLKVEWRMVAGRPRVYTNGTMSRARSPLYSLCAISPKSKDVLHYPMLISPEDHGKMGVYGVDRPCKFQSRCGRAFDAFGFSCCQLAWARGRLFGLDVHSRKPVLKGIRELCRHCLYSLAKPDRYVLQKAASSGAIEHPSLTYRKMITDRKRLGFPEIKRFLDR